MFRVLFFLSAFMIASQAFSALEYNQGKRCTEYLGELSDENTRYNFTRTGPRGAYNVVEVPTSSSNGKYVTVYTENGYSEINTETGYCNAKAKDPNKNRTQKLLAMFKTRDDLATENLAKVMDLHKNQPMSVGILSLMQSSYIDAMRRDCAADFPEIHDYLAKNKKLPKAVYIDPVPPGLPGMNPYPASPEGIPPR